MSMRKYSLPPSPLGRKSSVPPPKEEKPTESENSNPAKACPNSTGASRKRKAKEPISREDDEKMEILTAVAACISINEKNREGESSEAADDNGMQLLAAVATGEN
ncbi:hypothetical protein AAZX31_06G115700 [Glycine max]|nr:hypothetical protein GYH30_014867 [Glycine max]